MVTAAASQQEGRRFTSCLNWLEETNKHTTGVVSMKKKKHKDEQVKMTAE